MISVKTWIRVPQVNLCLNLTCEFIGILASCQARKDYVNRLEFKKQSTGPHMEHRDRSRDYVAWFLIYSPCGRPDMQLMCSPEGEGEHCEGGTEPEGQESSCGECGHQ